MPKSTKPITNNLDSSLCLINTWSRWFLWRGCMVARWVSVTIYTRCTFLLQIGHTHCVLAHDGEVFSGCTPSTRYMASHMASRLCLLLPFPKLYTPRTCVCVVGNGRDEPMDKHCVLTLSVIQSVEEKPLFWGDEQTCTPLFSYIYICVPIIITMKKLSHKCINRKACTEKKSV